MVEHPTSAELRIAASRLAFSPVMRIEWQFIHETNFGPQDDLWIQGIWMDPEAHTDQDTIRVTLYGVAWRCFLTMGETNLSILLRDLEVPYLFSGRSGIKRTYRAKKAR